MVDGHLSSPEASSNPVFRDGHRRPLEKRTYYYRTRTNSHRERGTCIRLQRLPSLERQVSNLVARRIPRATVRGAVDMWKPVAVEVSCHWIRFSTLVFLLSCPCNLDALNEQGLSSFRSCIDAHLFHWLFSKHSRTSRRYWTNHLSSFWRWW